MLTIPQDVIALHMGSGQWLLYNVFARTSIATTHKVFEILNKLIEKPFNEVEREFANESFPVWQTDWFSNYKGLLADPTRLDRNFAQTQPIHASLTKLLDILKSKFLVVEDEKTYRTRFAPKRTILDREHFGNFHQQLSYELLIRKREHSATWWLEQKFEKGFARLNNTLYRAVQEYNLVRYFKQHFTTGKTVVDVGCGIGYYTEMMAEDGVTVLGVDPNPEYLAIAKQRSKGRASYEVMNPGVPRGLERIADASADFVFTSDALLFYFVPESPKQEGNIDILLQDARRILKPAGRFVCVDPHYVFWLMPWLGDERHPFTILTEYMNKSFGVVPSLSRFIQVFVRNGFGLADMQEFHPDPAFEKVDRRAYCFAREYPLWQLYEWRKMEAEQQESAARKASE